MAVARKSLRVTRPVADQRDTYSLQLPYHWSLPLTVASSGMHWLLSQRIFIVRIDTYDLNGDLNCDSSKAAIGFSGA
ncbi:hypothetical protein G6011_02350 [Alternaria panax]|uniref:Uncharacterized protein n=1 Tax=Alternaria panax TaxID=48097 RepID=A0AAD4I7B6_9PLEO|nr:hypothetical protein G6011_02350 [Alternaria panax]